VGQGENEKERLDRELIELLNELRVALPGVQVLFAFLLTVPFSQRFSQLTSKDRAVYFAALGCAAAASALLIAPSIHARVIQRPEDREWLLRVSSPLMLAGSCFLMGGIACAIYLVADVLYRSAVAGIAAAVTVVVILWTWFGIPYFHRLNRDDNSDASHPERAS
jgi:hypothetical protein